MIKKYFTALIPASDIFNKILRLQENSGIDNPFFPFAPLEFYDDVININDYTKNIDLIKEFYTTKIEQIDNWLVLNLNKDLLIQMFPLPNDSLFPKNNFSILIGQNYIIENINTTDLESKVIRNWTLAFYELIIWNEHDPFSNIELIEHWKKKKRKLKG